MVLSGEECQEPSYFIQGLYGCQRGDRGREGGSLSYQMVRVYCQREPPGHPGVSQYCPARHQSPPLLPRSPSKRKMQRISNLSIAVMYVMYFLAALFGYLTFYGMAGPWGAEAEARLGGKGLASGHSTLRTIGAH